jgi:hypothetical protein
VGDILNPLLQIGQGTIKAVAGGGIQLNDGAIRTTRGGSIDLTAVSGDIDAGRNAAWLVPFGASGARVDPQGAGGIATQAGGCILLTALRQLRPGDQAPSGPTPSGPGPGTSRSGRAISREFFVGNGHGDVRLGGHFGTDVRTTTIDLANGSTAYVEAADIHLGQIRNPQGVISNTHRFNYGNAAVELVATQGDVELAGDNLAGNTDGINLNRILAPNLTARALAGDILVNNDFVLFPSASGNLVLEAFGDITNTLPFTVDLPTTRPADPLAAPGQHGAHADDHRVRLDPLQRNRRCSAEHHGPDYRTDYFPVLRRGAPVPLHTGDATDRIPRRRMCGVASASRRPLWDIGRDLGSSPSTARTWRPRTSRGSMSMNRLGQRITDRRIPVIGPRDDPIYTAIRLGGPACSSQRGRFADSASRGITVGSLSPRPYDNRACPTRTSRTTARASVRVGRTPWVARARR